MPTWIIIIEWLARGILLGLFGLSIWSISIIIERKRFFKNYETQAQIDFSELLNLISTSNIQNSETLINKLKNLVTQKNSFSAKTIQAALAIIDSHNPDLKNKGEKNSQNFEGRTFAIDQIEKNIQSFWIQERKVLEKGLSILGTLGSTTPFVGLFGTILGIIVSFGALSAGMIDSQKVMLSLAEALILTAVGLAVAIPAVVSFNYFSRRLLLILRDGEALKEAFIAHLPRN